MTPQRRTRTAALPRTLQWAAAGTSVLLLSSLAVGVALGHGDTAGTPAVQRGHHGTVLPDAAPTDAAAGGGGTAAAAAVELAPGTKIGADGRIVHDHGDLEVTVMLATDGETEILGPVEPGDSISFVNHTTADQVLTTDDGSFHVDVPLVRLVTLQAPDAPGTYRLVSRTDRTVTADVVVTADASDASETDVSRPGAAGTGDAAAVVTALDDEGRRP